MPRLTGLIEDFAQRFNFEPTKVASLARVMREAGLLTQGARGVNAPMASSMDAARLLIAMMLDSKMATVAEDVDLFGRFKAQQKFSDVFAPETLEECLAGMIDYCGQTGGIHHHGAMLVVCLRPYVGIADATVGYIREAGNDEQGDEDGMIEDIRVVSFIHPDIGDDLSQGLPPSYFEATKRFPSGFYQEPKVTDRELVAIGQVVAGHQPIHWKPE
jgi:hypothetical protein